VSVATVVGADAAGADIVDGLRSAGVGVGTVLRRPGNSPFTYVLVDTSSATRTCIHTPGSCGELLPADCEAGGALDCGEPSSEKDGNSAAKSEVVGSLDSNSRTKRHKKSHAECLTSAQISAVDCLANCWLLHCDSRHTEGSVTCARRANTRRVLVSVDCEKDRPYFEELLPCADVLFTNSVFPTKRCPEPNSVVFETPASMASDLPEKVPLRSDNGHQRSPIVSPEADAVVCTTARGQARLLATFPRVQLVVSTLGALGAVAAMRKLPTVSTAVNNTSCSFSLELGPMAGHSSAEEETIGLVKASWFSPFSNGDEYDEFTFVYVGAWPLGENGAATTPEQVVDTTGAGDAFIGGALHALRQGAPIAKILAAGTFVAGQKVQAQGARSNLPSAAALQSAIGM